MDLKNQALIDLPVAGCHLMLVTLDCTLTTLFYGMMSLLFSVVAPITLTFGFPYFTFNFVTGKFLVTFCETKSKDVTNEEFASFNKSLSHDSADHLSVSQCRGCDERGARLFQQIVVARFGRLFVSETMSEHGTNEVYASFYKSLLHDSEDHLSVRQYRSM